MPVFFIISSASAHIVTSFASRDGELAEAARE